MTSSCNWSYNTCQTTSDIGGEIPISKELEKIDFKTHLDICLRATCKRHSHSGHLDAGVYVGDHHAVDVQGPYYPSEFCENRYKVGIIEYHSRHLVMFFVKEKSAVYECVESYLAHELAKIRVRNTSLKQRTVVTTSDFSEAVYTKMLKFLSKHGVLQSRSIANTPEQLCWPTVS